MRRMKTKMLGRLMFRQRGRCRIKMIQMMMMMMERMTRDHPSNRVGPLLGFSRFFLFSFNSKKKKVQNNVVLVVLMAATNSHLTKPCIDKN